MADKTYTRLSSVTLADFRDQLTVDPVFNSLSESQQNTVINAAIDQYNEKSNLLGLDEYKFNAVSDADLVLSPSVSGNAAQYEDYLEIDFEAYDGTAEVVTANTDTNVGDLTFDDPPTIDVSGALAVYTISITGSTFDGRLYFEPPYPGLVSFELVNTTTFKVHAQKSHSAFSIVLKKRKQT